VIKEVGARAIADALKVNTTLKVLNVSTRSIPLSGVTAIAKALRKNQTLHSLHLAGVPVGNEGSAELGESLKVVFGS
jgi:hypothetical protein